MKRVILLLMRFFLVICLVSLTSCIGTRFLQRADVAGLPYHHPVIIPDKKHERHPVIQTQILFDNKGTMNFNTGTHTKVNENGQFVTELHESGDYYVPDDEENIYEFAGSNLRWNTPYFQLSTNVSFSISEQILFQMGGSYGSVKGEYYGTFHLGAGYSWEYKNWILLAESFFNFTKKTYHVDYVELRDDGYVKFESFIDNGITTNLSWAATLCSQIPDWLVNFFERVSWGKINLYEEVGGHPMSYNHANNYYILATGVYYNLSLKSKVLLGVNFNSFTNKPRRYNTWDTFIQYNYAFD